jgi:hypothetical protein
MIGNWEFTYVNECSIDWNRDNFTRTAQFSLPVRFYKRNLRIFEQIKIGDKVTIQMGYYPKLEKRFAGYVVRREPNSPLQVFCEDESWQYKQRFVDPVTQEDTTLEKFIKATYTGKITKIGLPDTKIGDWRVVKYTTFMRVLDTLRTTFGITANWDLDGGLVINSQFNEISPVTGVFDFNKNLIDTQSLDFQEAAEFSQIVYGVSEQAELNEDDATPIDPVEVWSFYDATGKIQSAEVDPHLQGNMNTFKIPYQTFDELKALTEARLENLNFTGYTGSFLTFGEPIVDVNDDCQIINKERKSMEGRYRIKGVSVKLGVGNGYKQDIELARKTG